MTTSHAAIFVSLLVHVGIVAAIGHGGELRAEVAPRAETTAEVEAFLLPIRSPRTLAASLPARSDPPRSVVPQHTRRRSHLAARPAERASVPSVMVPSGPPFSVEPAPIAVSIVSAGATDGSPLEAGAVAPPPDVPAGPSAEDLGAFMASYGAAVLARVLGQVRFPEAASRAGVGGTVIVELAIDGSGRLVGAQVVGDAPALLRPAALEAVARAAPFGTPPGPLLAAGRPLVFQLPVRFVLR